MPIVHTPRLFITFRPFTCLCALLCLLACTDTSHAVSDLVSGSFVDAGVTALGRGGVRPLPAKAETLDFLTPLDLDSAGKVRFDLGYRSQLTAKVYRGRWQGSHADSEAFESTAAAPFSLLGGRISGNLAVGYGFESSRIEARNDLEQTWVGADDRFQSAKGGIYLDLLRKLHLGLAFIDTGYRGNLELPVEVALDPVPWLRIGYRHSYLDFAQRFRLRLSGHDGEVPLKILEEVDLLYGKVQWGPLQLGYENELRRTDNRRIEGRIELPGSTYLIGEYFRRDHRRFTEEFSVDGEEGGYLIGDLKRSGYRVGAGVRLSPRWVVELNYRHADLSLGGGGLANTSAVAGFWPGLVLGNYNYVGSASVQSDQYHLGCEYRGERFSFSAGGQYIDLRPAAGLDYWRSVLFGLGRADAASKELTVDRIEMLFLGAGIGYTWRNVEIRYAVGQFLPIATHDRASATPAQDGTEGGGGGSGLLDRAWDKIRHYPGGGLQRLLVTVTF